MNKCKNCNWEGEETVGPLEHCPNCGDNTIKINIESKSTKKKEEKINFDLNNDGKVDKKDVSIAAKLLGKTRQKKKKGAKK